MLIGIVGKPNVGKSTFFKSMTLADIEIANYPFATISPNTGAGHVKIKDVAQDFGKPSNPREGYVLGEYRFVPVELLDVAGLVPGAHEGKGLGNKFLDDLNQANALIHVIDISGSTNEKGEPVEPLSYNPAEDIKFLEVELDMWFLGILKKGWEKLSRTIKYEGKEIAKPLAKQLSGLRVTEDMVKDCIRGLDNDPTKWGESVLKELASSLRKKAKPMIIAANKLDIPGAKDNLERIKKEFPDHTIISCSSESELALKEAAKHDLISYIPGSDTFEIIGDLSSKQENALKFIKDNSLPTGVQEILNYVVFEILDMVAVHPGGANKLEDSDGNVLPDCFLMKKGLTALDFAFRLHTDFGEKFIRAIDVKTKKVIGKNYLLKHLDIIELILGK
jgi:ribosome-binding ATPase